MCQWRHYQLTVDTFKLSWYFTWFNFNFLIYAEVLVLRYIKTVGLIGKLIKSLHYSFIYFNSTHSANGVIGGNGWYVELWDHCGVNSIHQSTFKYVEIIFLFLTKKFFVFNFDVQNDKFLLQTLKSIYFPPWRTKVYPLHTLVQKSLKVGKVDS